MPTRSVGSASTFSDSAAVNLSRANLRTIESRNQNPTSNPFQPVEVPLYDPSRVTPGIVHIGVGGFHRSHQAVYTSRILHEDPSWGICGVGLVPPDARNRDLLKAQDNLYTVITKPPEGPPRAEVVGSLVGFELAGAASDPMSTERVVKSRLADASTRIVGLTVTEKAYNIDDSTGGLDMMQGAVQADISDPEHPTTAVGLLVAGLRERRRLGMAPFTVMSCDNLPMNGKMTRRLVQEHAERVDTGLARWISDTVSFPNTMVDRITPAPGPEDMATLERDFGILDSWPVGCEDFKQWVIEDEFTMGRPSWDSVGALAVPDVEPYEMMKLRLLNGGHSALAYLSWMAGHRKVDRAMADPLVRDFVRVYMEEVKPTVPPVPGVDLNEYIEALISRFSNENVSDDISRLCQDGSKKMVGFIRDALAERIASGGPTCKAALAVAGWISYLRDASIHIDDPNAGRLCEAAREIGRGPATAAPFLREFLGEQVGGAEAFAAEVSKYLESVETEGARAVLEKQSQS